MDAIYALILEDLQPVKAAETLAPDELVILVEAVPVIVDGQELAGQKLLEAA